VIGEISSPSEVTEHRLDTTVVPGNAIVAGHGPRDVPSERASCGFA
jgi:hypothetical protein